MNLSRQLFVLLGGACILAGPPAHAEPLHIEAETMVLDHHSKRADFSGEVLLTRGDFRLRCDRLTARYRENSHQLEKATAYGHVRMRQGATHGTSDTAILDQRRGTLTLQGHAVIEKNGDRIEGATIIHRLQQQQTRVMPEKDGRTRIILESDDSSAQPPSDGGRR